MAEIIEKPVKYLFIVLSFLLFMYGVETVCMFAQGEINEQRELSTYGDYNLSVNNSFAQSTGTNEKGADFIGFVSGLFSWLTFTAVPGTPVYISIFLTIVSTSLWVVLILLIINMVTHFIPFIG